MCKSTLKKITEESKVEVTFPLIHLGNSQNLLEKSNRKVIELKLDITTPFYIFYKNEKMQESVKIGYEFSNTSQEYDLSIEFLNLKNLN